MAQVFKNGFTALQSPVSAAMLITGWCVGLPRALPYAPVQMYAAKFD